MELRKPRAFISHSPADCSFVEKFASDLRSNGVDAWYAGWEIKPGDSIRAKIDKALADCTIFIIVLSKSSIDRPWVQTELDAATVRKLDGKVQQIIPIKIDACGDLPPMLGSLLWEDFSTKRYDLALTGVLHSIFSVETKPPLGNIPELPPLVASRGTRISSVAAVFWVAVALAILLIASKLSISLGLPTWVGQVLAGGVLAGIVWVFFWRVEAVLREDTKLEVALWLVGIEIGKKFESWPHTFWSIFSTVFGNNALSFKCLYRSALASYSLAVIVIVVALTLGTVNPRTADGMLTDAVPKMLIVAVFTNVLPDYLSLLITRSVLALMKKTHKGVFWVGLLFVDFGLTALLGMAVWLVMTNLTLNVWASSYDLPIERTPIEKLNAPLSEPYEVLFASLLDYSMYLWLLPGFVTSIWLWLYAGSGFLLKAARRFDIGFEWFNRHCDIEKKPLQSIGLVAGALVALVYWSAVAVSRVVH
jgi:hypothetical protein